MDAATFVKISSSQEKNQNTPEQFFGRVSYTIHVGNKLL